MHILKPEETTRLFQIELDENNDTSIKLPIIAISRNKEIELLCSKKQPRTFNAFPISIDKTNKKDNIPENFITLNVIPMKIRYNIDIYTKGMEEADEYLRNFVFNFVNYPKLVVNIPYNGINFEHNALIQLEETLTDNSDIKEHLFPDQFTRYSLKIFIDDAYLFSAPIQEAAGFDLSDPSKFNAELLVEDRTTKEIIEQHKII